MIGSVNPVKDVDWAHAQADAVRDAYVKVNCNLCPMDAELEGRDEFAPHFMFSMAPRNGELEPKLGIDWQPSVT